MIQKIYMPSYFDMKPLLQNDLVKLSPLGNNDFEKLYYVASDPEIWEQHPANDRYKKEVFRAFFDEALASGSAFLVFDVKTNEAIGSTRYYDYDENQSRVAIGYTFLAKKYWGGKYNRAMKKLLLDHAFQYVSSVLFHIGINNIRSQRATMKLGAKKTENSSRPGKDHYQYELTKADWMKLTS